MIKVLQVICISLERPVRKLLDFLLFLAGWAVIASAAIGLLAFLVGQTWLEIAISLIGLLFAILSVFPAFFLFFYWYTVKETIEYAKSHNCSLRHAWNEVTSN